MSKTLNYTQCMLRRGTQYHVCWIPSKFATRGRTIDVKVDSKWSRGWFVLEVWTIADAEYVEAREQDYKKQRKASDV